MDSWILLGANCNLRAKPFSPTAFPASSPGLIFLVKSPGDEDCVSTNHFLEHLAVPTKTEAHLVIKCTHKENHQNVLTPFMFIFADYFVIRGSQENTCECQDW